MESAGGREPGQGESALGRTWSSVLSELGPASPLCATRDLRVGSLSGASALTRGKGPADIKVLDGAPMRPGLELRHCSLGLSQRCVLSSEFLK